LHNAPHYTALSYTSGDQSYRSTTVVDGTAFTISKNLEIALRHLRRQSGRGPRALWVDQICIDQRNNEEKSHQVRLMRPILSTASKVLAWLGASTASSEYAMDRFPRVHESRPGRSLLGTVHGDGLVDVSNIAIG
jgi:hypothetical protein